MSFLSFLLITVSRLADHFYSMIFLVTRPHKFTHCLSTMTSFYVQWSCIMWFYCYYCINRITTEYFAYRVAVLAALAIAAICGFWLWKRRRSALADDCTSSERTSTGPWYPPPHYSRCSSFVQALPPPYNEVFKNLSI